MNQIKAFEKEIAQLITGTSSELTNINIAAINDNAIANLNNQLIQNSIDRATEVFGPSLAILASAKPNPIVTKETLTLMDFNAVSELWLNGEEAKRIALNKQLKEIEQMLDCNTIKAISILDGDSHNSGYQPLLIITDCLKGQQKYIYKSIDPTAYQVVEAVSTFICKGLGREPLMERIAIATTNSYLRKFTESQNSLTQNQIKNYFYLYGVMVSLASFLEVIDLHFENIVTTKQGPKIIDAEFLLIDTQSKRGKWSYKKSGLFEGITSPIGQHSALSFIRPLFEQSKHELRYRFTRDEVREEHLINDLLGRTINPKDHIAEMQKGALEADAYIRKNSDAIQALIDLTKSENHKIRCFARGTAYYRILQLQMWTPNPPSLKDRTEKLRKKLASRRSAPQYFKGEMLQGLIKAEIDDILNMDIPYFWINGTTGSLNHHSGFCIPEYGRPTSAALAIRTKLAPTRTYERDFSGLKI